MVIGNGMVAGKFSSYNADKRFLIFASGVSNSKTRNIDAYKREFELLKSTVKTNPEKSLVYFSSCCLYDLEEMDSMYSHHKKQIEAFIQKQCDTYHIFRVSHLVGKSLNKNTVLNFLVHHICEEINFDLWLNATRNLIDIDDMYSVVDDILQNGRFINQILDVASPFNYSVKEIVETLEKYSGKTATYTLINKGAYFKIDISPIKNILKNLKIDFSKNYLDRIITKYYSVQFQNREFYSFPNNCSH